MANEAVEAGRKDLRSRLTKEQSLQLKRDRWLLLKRQRDLGPMDEALLSGWIENYPDLYELHKVKEGFCDIWDQRYSRKEAINAFDLWVNSIPDDVLRARVLFIGAKHKIRPKPFKHGVAEKTIGYALPDDLVINYGVEFPHEADKS